MTLGSPVGSPMQTASSPGSSVYLPSFLLGDTNTVRIYKFLFEYSDMQHYIWLIPISKITANKNHDTSRESTTLEHHQC